MKKIIIGAIIVLFLLIIGGMIFGYGLGYLKSAPMEGFDTIKGVYWKDLFESCKCIGLKTARYCLGIYYNCQELN